MVHDYSHVTTNIFMSLNHLQKLTMLELLPNCQSLWLCEHNSKPNRKKQLFSIAQSTDKDNNNNNAIPSVPISGVLSSATPMLVLQYQQVQPTLPLGNTTMPPKFCSSSMGKMTLSYPLSWFFCYFISIIVKIQHPLNRLL